VGSGPGADRFTEIKFRDNTIDTPDFRGRFLTAAVFFGFALCAITELLSAFQGLRRTPLIICWAIVMLGMIVIAWRARWHAPRVSYNNPIIALCVLGCAGILTLTAITAAFSPPNSSDAMAYHLPRVIYWAEQSSVRFFPTQYLNQIMLQPLAEYLMLHLYLLTGSDALTNFVQWFASLVCMIGVSAVAREFAVSASGQAIAALFCATIPSGVLASSGAKNDYFLAMWLVLAVFFAMRFTVDGKLLNAILLGGAVGCALLTKATAYVFAPGPILAVLLLHRRIPAKRMVAGLALVWVVGVGMNAPQYARNYELSGSILGFDSAQGDGVYRWRNQTFSGKNTLSNVLRNISEQLGARDPRWNQRVYGWVVQAHRRLGMDPSDPNTTWPYTVYEAPRNANHEVNVPNKWQLALLACVSCVLVFRSKAWLGYIGALLFGFLAFCFYLKWQLFLGRLFLPLLVLSAPLMGAMRWPKWPRLFEAALCYFLLSDARRPALENWVRPLKGERSVLQVPRNQQYFADMTSWNNKSTYFSTVEVLSKTSCEHFGVDITNLQLEYPLLALIRQKKPAGTFVHTGVQNASARYPQPVSGPPCAVICLDCAGDTKRLALYADFHKQVPVDKFVVLLRD
jgi:Dolichyl-phosphate-mannose-protein mannosyltransferase